MLRKDIELAHFYRSRRITFIMFYFDEFFLFLCTVLNAFMLYSISFQFFSSILYEQYCCRHMANNNLKTIRLQKLGFPTLVQIESQRPSKEHYHCHYLFFFPSNNIQHRRASLHTITASIWYGFNGRGTLVLARVLLGSSGCELYCSNSLSFYSFV